MRKIDLELDMDLTDEGFEMVLSAVTAAIAARLGNGHDVQAHAKTILSENGTEIRYVIQAVRLEGTPAPAHLGG